jgi:hypothetical protein
MKEILPGSVKLADEPGKDFCCKSATTLDVVAITTTVRVPSEILRTCRTVQGRLRHLTRYSRSRPPLPRTQSEDDEPSDARAAYSTRLQTCRRMPAVDHTRKLADRRALSCFVCAWLTTTGRGSML